MKTGHKTLWFSCIISHLIIISFAFSCTPLVKSGNGEITKVYVYIPSTINTRGTARPWDRRFLVPEKNCAAQNRVTKIYDFCASFHISSSSLSRFRAHRWWKVEMEKYNQSLCIYPKYYGLAMRMFLPQRWYHLICDWLTVLERKEIVAILVSYITSHIMKPSDPLLLANVPSTINIFLDCSSVWPEVSLVFEDFLV